MCGMYFSSSVRFLFGFEKKRGFGLVSVSVRFWKEPSVRFYLWISCKYKKRVSCLSCLCAFCGFLNAQLVSNACFLKFNLNFNLNYIVYVYMMPNMPLSCVRNVKNVKALWEWLKYWLFVWDNFCFAKSHRNWITEILGLTFWLWFGLVWVFKNRNRTEIWFTHIPNFDAFWNMFNFVASSLYYTLQ